MGTFIQDLRFAARTLVKRPGFAAVAVLTLALGIGANTAIFSIVYGIMLKPLPLPEPQQLVTVWENREARGGPVDEWTNGANFLDWRERNRVFESLAVYGGWNADLSGAGEPERLLGEIVSPEYFRLLGMAPARGRDFQAAEGQPGAEGVVVLSHELWQRRFGADPEIVGRSLTLNDSSFNVIGVLPAGFRSPFSPDARVWRTRTIDPSSDDRGNAYLRVVGRLRSDVGLAEARDDMARVAAEIAEQYPAEYRDVGASIVPLREQIAGPGRPALLALLGTVGFVLLIACANVANLLLGRSAERQREIALRATLGAGRSRLARQLLTESLLLAFVGGGLGILLGVWGQEILRALAPPAAPRLDEVAIDGTVVGFSFGLMLLTGILFGSAPALQASRLELSGALRNSRGSVGSLFRRRLRAALVVGELALALALLVGAGLLVRSFDSLQRVEPGFAPDRVVAFGLQLPQTRYEAPQQIAGFYADLVERLARHPGVESAATISSLPLSGSDSDVTITVEGLPPAQPGDEPAAWYRQITPGYFATLGIRTVQGRSLEAGDRADTAPVVMVNETLARRYFAGADPIGRRLKLGGPDSQRPWREIVGVVADIHARNLARPPVDEIYLAQAQMPTRQTNVILRLAEGQTGALALVRAEVDGLDANLPVGAPVALDQLVARSVAIPRFTTQMLTAFALLALVLAAVGIYGVMAYSVSQRTREIGIRMALGAERSSVVRLVVGQGLGLTLAGLALGVGTALALGQGLEALLFGISPTDPATFAATAALLIAVGTLACYLPARRAAQVDPVVSLRDE
ncbi:MAG: ABC transporter permease [Acidobacteriota bacterium]